MRATWLNTEYEVMQEIITSRINSMKDDLENLKQRYDKENKAIDNLPWYKAIFKTKHDKDASFIDATRLVHSIWYLEAEIADLKQVLSKVCKVASSYSLSLTLDEDELQLLFG